MVKLKTRSIILSTSILFFSIQIKPIPAIKGLFNILKIDDIGFGQALSKSHWIENVYQYAEGVAPGEGVKFEASRDPVANLIRNGWFRLSVDLPLRPQQRGPSLVLENGELFGKLMNHIYKGTISDKKIRKRVVDDWQKYYKEIKKQRKLGKVSKKLFAAFVDTIAEAVANCQNEKMYLPRTTEAILWALFFDKLIKLSINKFIEKLNKVLLQINETYRAKKRIGEDLYTLTEITAFNKSIKELSRPEKIKKAFENYDLALHGLLFDAYPSAVAQGNYPYEYKKGKLSKSRPNCFEAALLDLFSIFWYNPRKARYDDSLFKETMQNGEGFSRLRNALKYLVLGENKDIPGKYKKNMIISYLRGVIKESELEELSVDDLSTNLINRNAISQEWMNIISGRNVNKIEYPYKSFVTDDTKPTYVTAITGNTGKKLSDKRFEIRSRGSNFIKMFNFMYDTKAKSLKELGKLISTKERTISFEKDNKDLDDNNLIYIEVENTRLGIVWNFNLNIQPGHGWIEVPGREASGKEIYGSTCKKILKEIVQSKENAWSGDKKIIEKLNFLTLSTYQYLLEGKINWKIPILNLIYYSLILKEPMKSLAVIENILKNIQFYDDFKPFLYNLIKFLPREDATVEHRLVKAILLSDKYKTDSFIKKTIAGPRLDFRLRMIEAILKKDIKLYPKCKPILYDIIKDLPDNKNIQTNLGRIILLSGEYETDDILREALEKLNPTDLLWSILRDPFKEKAKTTNEYFAMKKRGAKVTFNKTDPLYEETLYGLVSTYYVEILKDLLKENPNIVIDFGWFLLKMAFDQEDLNFAYRIVDHPLFIKVKARIGWYSTMVMKAKKLWEKTKNENAEKFFKLIKDKAPQGELLIVAVKFNDLEEVKKIIKGKIDFEVLHRALYFAVDKSYTDIVRELLKKREIDVDGDLFLVIALSNGNKEIAKLLLAHPNLENLGSGALVAAIRTGEPEMVSLILAHPKFNKLALNKVVRGHSPPLIQAIEKGYLNVAKEILKRKYLDVNVGYFGKTALNYALNKGYIDVAQMIVSHPSFEKNKNIENVKKILERIEELSKSRNKKNEIQKIKKMIENKMKQKRRD